MLDELCLWLDAKRKIFFSSFEVLLKKSWKRRKEFRYRQLTSTSGSGFGRKRWRTRNEVCVVLNRAPWRVEAVFPYFRLWAIFYDLIRCKIY